MADDDAATAAMTVTFRANHLIQLRAFNHVALDVKLVRVEFFLPKLARTSPTPDDPSSGNPAAGIPGKGNTDAGNSSSHRLRKPALRSSKKICQVQAR